MQNSNAQFVSHWIKSGPILEAIRREELRALRHEDQEILIDELLTAGLQQSQSIDQSGPATSGLIEMQNLFSRLIK